MIPRTVLPESTGGDGDPLDAIVIGSAIERGTVVEAKLIGVLWLVDNNERDDKLITVSQSSSSYDVISDADLEAAYPGVREILEIWFSNYKGLAITNSTGYGDAEEARKALKQAIADYLVCDCG